MKTQDEIIHYRLERAQGGLREARLMADLFENRQKGDYMDFVHFTKEQVRPWIAEAELFVGEMTALTRTATTVESDDDSGAEEASPSRDGS